ncbi:MAG: DUF1294 domain-containing protein, partial [Saprospiraceae bacterium]
ILIVLNIRTYILMIWDKQKAKKKDAWRISEKQLLTSGAVFGSLGIIGGMFPPVHHKKRKSWFRYGMPLALLLQIYISYEIYIWAMIRFNLYFEFPF